MENFRKLEKEKRKEILLQICHTFKLRNVRPKLKDLEKLGIFAQDIRNLFDNYNKFLEFGEFRARQRKSNMSDEELKNYLKSVRILETNNEVCPGFANPKSVCNKICVCWLTNQFYIDPIKKRQSIGYKDKMMYLSRLSYLLFNGPLPVEENVDVSHICDNSLCYNPNHLELQTHQTNVAGSIERGTRQTKELAENPRKPHDIKDPYNFPELLKWVRTVTDVSDTDEWLYKYKLANHGYPVICIKGKNYSQIITCK